MRILSVIVLLCVIGVPLMAQEKVALFIPSPFVREALSSKLQEHGFKTVANDTGTDIQALFLREKPDYVLVDGSALDSVDMMLIYELQVLQAARLAKVKKLILLSNSTIYPKNAPLPLQEKTLAALNTKTITDPYALAKLTSFAKCREVNDAVIPHFILGVYAEVYGPQDPRCIPKNTHSLYQAIDRIARAKKENQAFTVISSDGKAQYDLLYIDDFAEAACQLLKTMTEHEMYNIGTGRDQKVQDIAENLQAVAHFKGEMILDQNCYDAVTRRVLDARYIYALGWHPTTSLQEGLDKTSQWYDEQLTKS